jgi:beta-glucosidase
VFAGDYYTEGSDRQCLSLECPDSGGDQDGLISAVAATNRRTVVVLESGGPDLTPWRGSVAALLEAWYPGERGGPAIARALFGDVDPSGRLPATFPASQNDIPTAGDPQKYPGVGQEVHYKEGVFVGYRWYDLQRSQPAFPFGFGLSYTRFALKGLRITRGGRGALVTVRVRVKNVGRRRGTAVPELYLGLPSLPGAPEPLRQLKGFARVSVAPGRSRVATIGLGPRELSYWDVAANGWRIARGCTRVTVASSERDAGLHGTIAQGGARCRRGAVAL